MSHPNVTDAAKVQRENRVIIAAAAALAGTGSPLAGFFLGAVLLHANTQRHGIRSVYRDVTILAQIAFVAWFFGQLIQNWADFKTGFVEGYRFMNGS